MHSQSPWQQRQHGVYQSIFWSCSIRAFQASERLGKEKREDTVEEHWDITILTGSGKVQDEQQVTKKADTTITIITEGFVYFCLKDKSTQKMGIL